MSIPNLLMRVRCSLSSLPSSLLISLTSVVLAIFVFADLQNASAAPSVSTTIVISEFRTRGPSGANDEFIELYNLS